MTSDVWLFLGFTTLAFVTFFLWVRERLPRARALIGVLAVICLVAAAVLHGFVAVVVAPPGPIKTLP